MKKYVISQAAALSGLTAETLRHYDRIGLVKPSETDDFTGYRYYTDHELVRLKTIRLLRCMDLSLREIEELLAFDNLSDVIAGLRGAELRALQTVDRIRRAVGQMKKARGVYEELAARQPVPPRGAVYDRFLAARTVLLSEHTGAPGAADLWQYHDAFYASLSLEERGRFAFTEDAGLLATPAGETFFAVCTAFAPGHPRLRTLPAGRYRCAVAVRPEDAVERLKPAFAAENVPFPHWYAAEVRVIGLLRWEYEVQVWAGPNAGGAATD